MDSIPLEEGQLTVVISPNKTKGLRVPSSGKMVIYAGKKPVGVVQKFSLVASSQEALPLVKFDFGTLPDSSETEDKRLLGKVQDLIRQQVSRLKEQVPWVQVRGPEGL